MNKIILENYNPQPYPIGEYELEKILYDYNGTTLILESEQHVVTIQFPKPIEFLRTSDEGNRIKTTHEILAEYGDSIKGYTLFKVLDSELSAWLESETFTALNKENSTHFMFATNNDITEIVSVNDPIISYKVK